MTRFIRRSVHTVGQNTGGPNLKDGKINIQNIFKMTINKGTNKNIRYDWQDFAKTNGHNRA